MYLKGKFRASGVIVGVIGILASIVYFFFDPEVASFFPACPFHTLTGLDCPGCGSQRALHEVLHGDFLAAFHHNALMVVTIPFLLYVAVIQTGNIFRRSPVYIRMLYHPLFPKIVCGIILVYTFVRNLPFAPFNWLYA